MGTLTFRQDGYYEFKFTRRWVLEQLKKRKYKITIEERENSKWVTFQGPFSKEPSTLSYQYALVWSNSDIEMDVAFEFFRWADVKIKVGLE